jgi:hypothetical protein
MFRTIRPAPTARRISRGFLWERREISAAVQRAVAHVRQCEINGREVTYINALNAGQLTALEAAAAALGVIVRY